MFKNLKAKLLAGLATCACLFAGAGAGVGVNVASAETSENTSSVTLGVEGEGGQSRTPVPTSGEGADGYSIEIVAKNVSYSDSIYILYAVDFAGFDESQNEVKMLFWDSLQTEYTVEMAESVKSSNAVVTIGDRECIVFYSDGIAAKEMNDMLYCRAYASVDGVAVYSDVEKYSVVDYVYEKRAGGGLTSNQTAIFADMLDYGTSAQKLFGYNTDFPANATYYTVTVEDGVLDDGFTWGRYLPNATATLTANAPATGYEFVGWKNGNGDMVSDVETVSLTVTENTVYTATYEEIVEEPEGSVGLAYSLTSDGAGYRVTGIGECTDTDIIIPATYNGLPVTAIGSQAFAYCSSLTSVVIPDSVTVIWSKAFYQCNKVTSVVIGDGVTSIGDDAFNSCQSLNNLVMGNSVQSIGEWTFYQCKSLANLVIPDSVTYIDRYAFVNSGLKEITLGAGLTEIGKEAFYGCNQLTGKLVLPRGLRTIGANAFYTADNKLREIFIPSSVVTIGDCAFRGYSSAKIYCEAESRPSGWYGSWSLDSKFIYWYRESEPMINGDGTAYDGDYWRYVDGEVVVWEYNPSSVFEYTSDGSSITITKYIGNYTDIVIPPAIDGLAVTSIGDNAFYACEKLTSVVIPDSVTSIGYCAFSDCSDLMSVIIGDSVTSIGSGAFQFCSGLENIKIGDSVTSIGSGAFAECSGLTSVVIPDGVTSIGGHAFYNCISLTIYCEAESQPEGWDTNWNYSNCPVVWACNPTTPASAFKYSISNAQVTITKYVGEYIDVVIPSKIDGLPVKIGDRAFSYCSSLTSVVIPDSVTSIGSDAFYQCSRLTIYCEAESQPSGWSSGWNYSNRPVVWGATLNTYSFETNGGQEIELIASIVAISLPYLEKEGYIFYGWYDNAEFSGSPLSAGLSYYSATNTTLYARWVTEEELEAMPDGTSLDKAFIAQKGSYSVTIDKAGEYVYFKFTATESGSVTIQSTGSYDTYGYLYNTGGSQITSNDDGAGNGQFKITYNVVAGQSYYIGVRLYSSSATGAFTLVIS